MRLLIVALATLILSGCVDPIYDEDDGYHTDNLTHIKKFYMSDLYKGKSGDCYLLKSNSMTVVKCEDFL